MSHWKTEYLSKIKGGRSSTINIVYMTRGKSVRSDYPQEMRGLRG